MPQLNPHRLGTTLLLGMLLVGFISSLGYGLVLYKTLTEGERSELKKGISAAMRPIDNLASRGVNGGNIMKLRGRDATALYRSSEVLYLRITGTTQGSPKTAFSAALPPKPIAYHYVAEGVDAKAMEVLADDTSQTGVNETRWLYLVRENLPEVKNGGNIVAVFSAEQLKGSIGRTVKSVAIISIVIIAITLFVALLVGKIITRPIILISRQIGEISESLDLSQRVDITSRNEIGDTAQTFNGFVNKIQALIAQVDDSITGISASAEHLTATTHASNKRVFEQESQAEQVATAMTEMTAVVEEVARNAKSAADSAAEADNQTASGKNVVDQAVQIINKVAVEVEHTSSAVQNLVDQTNNIGSVLDVIRGIAEQTNLLALNAAIEAARAGEQGRGFAVVADEVRTLAGRTQQSTEEIQKMIEKLQSGAAVAGDAMEKGIKEVDHAVEQASLAGNSLIEITESIAAISSMNQQIAISVEEQAKVAEEINRNIVSINDLTEQTALASKGTEHESEQLTNMSNSLKNLVNQFRI